MARVELIMPKMGESVSEATIITWAKEVGEMIELDETIVEIATDKVDSVRSSLKTGYYLWEPRSLNIDDMRKAAAFLVGEHDFSCFRGSMCQAKSPIKIIEYLQIDEIGDDLIIKVKANAFLHHMVRNLVGTLLKVGRGEESTEWMLSVLDSKDRKEAGPTAEPQGLYFIKAHYQTL